MPTKFISGKILKIEGIPSIYTTKIVNQPQWNMYNCFMCLLQLCIDSVGLYKSGLVTYSHVLARQQCTKAVQVRKQVKLIIL